MKSNQNAVYPYPSQRCLLRWGLWACEGRGRGLPCPLLHCPRAPLSPGRVPAGWKHVLLQMTRREPSLTFMPWWRTAQPHLPVCPGLLGSGKPLGRLGGLGRASGGT